MRDFTDDKHKRVDFKPYGGGPGMVIQYAPVKKALESLNPSKICLLSPQGKHLNQNKLNKLSKDPHLEDVSDPLRTDPKHYKDVSSRNRHVRLSPKQLKLCVSVLQTNSFEISFSSSYLAVDIDPLRIGNPNKQVIDGIALPNRKNQNRSRLTIVQANHDRPIYA